MAAGAHATHIRTFRSLLFLNVNYFHYHSVSDSQGQLAGASQCTAGQINGGTGDRLNRDICTPLQWTQSWMNGVGTLTCGNVEAGVGSIRTHPSTSPRIGPRRRRQGRRSESKTLDDSKQTANWGRSVQSIHEEVWTGGQCRMWVWRARTDSIINSCPLHRPPYESGLFEVGPLTRAWLQQPESTIIMRRWYTKEEEVHLHPLR